MSIKLTDNYRMQSIKLTITSHPELVRGINIIAIFRNMYVHIYIGCGPYRCYTTIPLFALCSGPSEVCVALIDLLWGHIRVEYPIYGDNIMWN